MESTRHPPSRAQLQSKAPLQPSISPFHEWQRERREVIRHTGNHTLSKPLQSNAMAGAAELIPKRHHRVKKSADQYKREINFFHAQPSRRSGKLQVATSIGTPG
jgi:hypothetical protein